MKRRTPFARFENPTTTRRVLASAGFGALLLSNVIFSVAPALANCGSPLNLGDGWAVSSPADAGFDTDQLCKVVTAIAASNVNIHSVLVERRGKLVVELYKRGSDRSLYSLSARDVAFTASDLHDMRSVSKSVVGLLTGIALDRGLIPEISSRVLDLYPEYPELREQNREAITLEHFMTMTSGLEWHEFDWIPGTIGSDRRRLFWQWSPARYVLSKPVVAPPGRVFNYSGGDTTVIADILVRASKKPLREFAQEALFEPLGIKDWEWTGDLYGVPLAFAGLRLRPRDLLKIGSVLLNQGEWQGRQIISANWVRQSLAPHARVNESGSYGYQWWIGSIDWKGEKLAWSGAFGDGGQGLFLAPKLDLAVVFTSGDYGNAAIGKAIDPLFEAIVAAINQ